MCGADSSRLGNRATEPDLTFCDQTGFVETPDISEIDSVRITSNTFGLEPPRGQMGTSINHVI